MTDKKEIIIDGVDVLYICKYGQTGLPICVDLEHRYCKLKSTNSKKCNLRPVVEYSNYEKLYKQLQRKKAECEELSNEIEELNVKYETVVNLAKKNADANEYCLQELEKENQKLKQALDEIEKIVTLDKTHIKYAGSTLVICDDILDIIRKAKGEE